MEKREKIIIISTVVVALYGAVDFFVLSKKKDSDFKKSQQDNSEIITTIAASLSEQTKGDRGEVQNLISKINKSWPPNVFANISTDQLFDKEDESDTKENISNNFAPSMFDFTGFVEMDDTQIAIINGMDYKIGDIIEGYTLKQITTDNITVTWKDIPFEVAIKPQDLSGDTKQKKKRSKIKTTQF